MRPIHTHTHYILLCFSQLLYPHLSSSVITSPSHTRSLAVFISVSYTDRNTQLLQAHATSFCYRHAKSCRKHKGSSFSFFFFYPGTKKKKAKCNNLGQKCWHLKMRLQLRWTTRLQLKWAESETLTDRLTPLSLSGLLILLFSHFCFPSSPPFIPHSYPTTLPICISLSCSSHPPATSGLHSSIPLSSSSTCPALPPTLITFLLTSRFFLPFSLHLPRFFFSHLLPSLPWLARSTSAEPARRSRGSYINKEGWIRRFNYR